MNLLDRKQYNDINNLNKKLLVYRKLKTDEVYHIFTIEKIENDNPTTYKTIKHYYLCIPTDQRNKCYCYDNPLHNITLDWNDKIYIISENEYIDIFRKFVQYDSQDKNNLDLSFIN